MPVVLIVLLVVVAMCCVGGGVALIFGYRFATRTVLPLTGCMLHFTDVQAAMNRYAADHGGRFPNAATWQDDLRPYYAQILKEHGNTGPIRQTPAEGDWGCDIDGVKTGIAFNSNAAGKKLSQITLADGAVMLFEIPTPKRNAAEPYKERDRASSPKLFGEPRGWVIAPFSGAVTVEGGQGRFKFEPPPSRQ